MGALKRGVRRWVNSGGTEGTVGIVLTVVVPRKKEGGPADTLNIEN